jgi:hypothetical protein
MGCAVHREPYEQPVRRPVTPPEGMRRSAYVDYLLRFVLEHSASIGSGIAGRLDAFERTLVALTRPWRAESPLAPARELRVSSETLDALLAWVEGDEHPQGHELERLGVFASGAVEDGSVPEGWVRIRLM